MHGQKAGELEEAPMRALKTLVGLGLALGIAGCANTLSSDMTVAEYCANSDRANDAVCRLKVEIDGQSTALAETQMSLSDARAIADTALTAADEARAAAASAQSTADAALALADEANDKMVCKTVTINNSAIGTCGEGYTLMGCEQTRYTTRAGGLSFLREVNNEQCRFNSKVLEMDVRCCTEMSASKMSPVVTMEEAAGDS